MFDGRNQQKGRGTFFHFYFVVKRNHISSNVQKNLIFKKKCLSLVIIVVLL